MKNFSTYIVSVLCLLAAKTTLANDCVMSKSGNAFTGFSYRVSLNSSVQTDIARSLDAAKAKLIERGQRILNTDVATGKLTAEQGTGARSIPLSLSIQSDIRNTRIDVDARLLPGMSVADEAIRGELCSYAQAATSQNSAPAAAQAQDTGSQVASSNPDNEFIKNGFPCLSGLCVGEDITQATAVKWLPTGLWMKTGYNVVPPDIALRNLKQIGIGGDDTTLQRIANAVARSHFRAEDIEALKKVQWLCQPFASNAEYSSSTGRPTRVEFSSFLDAQTGKLAFKVIRIVRDFPDVVSPSQRTDVDNSLRAAFQPVMDRYRAGQLRGNIGNLPNVQLNTIVGLPTVSLQANPAGADYREQERCGGKKKITIE